MTAKHVKLIVTGKLEWNGLADSLQRIFPKDVAEFDVVSAEEEDGPFAGFTSCRVEPTAIALAARRAIANEETPDNDCFPNVDRLMQHVAGSLSGRGAADFAILIEDLELVNRGNEHAVVQAVQDAATRHLERVKKHKNAPQKLDTILRERASFHLFDPMIEAYFFADDNALKKSGATFRPPTCSRQGLDPERFRVCCDEPFFDDNLGECIKGYDSVRNHFIPYTQKKHSKCPWNGTLRESHPKKYLSYLCRRESPFHFCTSYSETGDTQFGGGIAALQSLDWSKVFSRNDFAPCLRALIEDLEDALGIRPAISNWPQCPMSNAITSRCHALPSRVLRNV